MSIFRPLLYFDLLDLKAIGASSSRESMETMRAPQKPMERELRTMATTLVYNTRSLATQRSRFSEPLVSLSGEMGRDTRRFSDALFGNDSDNPLAGR
jgi:hypothetical protein